MGLTPFMVYTVQQTCAAFHCVRLHTRRRLYGLGGEADTKFMIILVPKNSQHKTKKRHTAALVEPTLCQLRHRPPRRTHKLSAPCRPKVCNNNKHQGKKKTGQRRSGF